MRPILPHQTFLHKPPQMTFLSPLGAMDFLKKFEKQKKHAACGRHAFIGCFFGPQMAACRID